MKHSPITSQFPGLKPGDGWCLCALRWKEAYEAGVAPPVKPEATHEKVHITPANFAGFWTPPYPQIQPSYYCLCSLHLDQPIPPQCRCHM